MKLTKENALLIKDKAKQIHNPEENKNRNTNIENLYSYMQGFEYNDILRLEAMRLCGRDLYYLPWSEKSKNAFLMKAKEENYLKVLLHMRGKSACEENKDAEIRNLIEKISFSQYLEEYVKFCAA